ncbi:MAG: hypothetical protein E7Z65_07870 [Thermoplasmata archaeon]|jgi:sulfur transfer protein SufE|nr:hypothetical protein [Thermoplasmata archaeon]
MISIEEEKDMVAKMKAKNNSDADYADGMLSVLTKVAEGKSPEEIKAFVNNTLRCLMC